MAVLGPIVTLIAARLAIQVAGELLSVVEVPDVRTERHSNDSR